MEPMEAALKNYLDLSPVSYLEATHDAQVYAIEFDGATVILASEAWVGTEPVHPVSNFCVLYSRYRAVFVGVREFELKILDPDEYPGDPVLSDVLKDEIRHIKIDLPYVIVQTDAYEVRFICKSFDVERAAPMASQVK